MKIPTFVIVIGLVIVSLVVLRGILTTLKHSAQFLTWGILLLVGIGGAILYTRGDAIESHVDDAEFQAQAKNFQYR